MDTAIQQVARNTQQQQAGINHEAKDTPRVTPPAHGLEREWKVKVIRKIWNKIFIFENMEGFTLFWSK